MRAAYQDMLEGIPDIAVSPSANMKKYLTRQDSGTSGFSANLKYTSSQARQALGVFLPLNNNFPGDPQEGLYNEQLDERSNYKISVLCKTSLGDLCTNNTCRYRHIGTLCRSG